MQVAKLNVNGHPTRLLNVRIRQNNEDGSLRVNAAVAFDERSEAHAAVVAACNKSKTVTLEVEIDRDSKNLLSFRTLATVEWDGRYDGAAGSAPRTVYFFKAAQYPAP